MQRKVLERDPVTGKMRERYVDLGPRRALPRHGVGGGVYRVSTLGDARTSRPRSTPRGMA